MMTRLAIYARYSSDLQMPTSLEDQVRLCRHYIENGALEREPPVTSRRQRPDNDGPASAPGAPAAGESSRPLAAQLG